ncbi:hypothetical protein Nizo2535_0968 [Lactiplantibacillus plantarum]|uniref:TetR/AcrR family transcriptional regulator n=1 Tax=Lactiplantibacillus plantarum TaxID=1590 RepID=UPI0007B5561E|nr:TetR/AcrR family transcriptional regulator [Lactiplantibacillus plantarum]KZU34490.1 hypothetical protein Nizo2535_0968 [Lactiplantibacillus plantarum]KZU75084.1 hypothetical protein Nizo2891_2835 [Lactiplantibacillus plantarum]
MADLRFMRTEKLIKIAFLELLKITPYDQISVAELAKQSLIDRSTFYAHYENIFELANALVDYEINQFIAAFSESKRQRWNKDFDNYTFFSDELTNYILNNRQKITLISNLPLGLKSFYHRLRKLLTTTYCSTTGLDPSDFSIYLLTNLGISDFEFILQNQRVPTKKELQLGLKKIAYFLQ